MPAYEEISCEGAKTKLAKGDWIDGVKFVMISWASKVQTVTTPRTHSIKTNNFHFAHQFVDLDQPVLRASSPRGIAQKSSFKRGCEWITRIRDHVENVKVKNQGMQTSLKERERKRIPLRDGIKKQKKNATSTLNLHFFRFSVSWIFFSVFFFAETSNRRDGLGLLFNLKLEQRKKGKAN